jgi:putative tricarboxylic transport membrane protein
MGLENILQSLLYILNPPNLLLVVVGTGFGILCGALPGISSSMAIILMLPFTYAMEPVESIAVLVAVYIGGACGGSISAILLRTPGTPEAVATTFDGYPMAMKGEAGKALGLAVSASSLGGIFSALAMVVAAPLLAVAALKFQSAEYFALALLGLSCVTSLGARNQLKAILSALLGLLISTVGLDPINGAERFTFQQDFLMNGVGYIPIMIGTFAIAEVYKNIGKLSQEGGQPAMMAQKVSLEITRLRELIRMRVTLIKSSLIGIIIGIVPAAGGAIASLVSYGEAVRSSKAPEQFGSGVPEGIVAAESANNAAVGGSLVPTLILGIPGSPTSAVIMAAFMIQGLRPGPLLLKDQPILLYSVFFSIILASFLLFVLGRYITREFAHILKLPYPLLGTLIMALGVVGAYALQNSYYDVLIMLIFSFVGYLFEKFGYSAPSLILGLILGGIAENALRQQLIISDGNWFSFFTRPLSLLILIFAVVALLSPYIRKKAKPTSKNKS